MSPIPFDQDVAQLLLRYAKLIVARGYVHNSLGNLAIRVSHPDFPHGVADVLRTDCACERFCSEFKDIHGDEGSDVPRQLLGAEHLGAAHGVAEAVATLRA